MNQSPASSKASELLEAVTLICGFFENEQMPASVRRVVGNLEKLAAAEAPDPEAALPVAAAQAPTAEQLYRRWHHAQGNRCAIAPWAALSAEQRAEWETKAAAHQQRQAPAPEWRCFHCEESFTDRAAAALHFGYSERQAPACKLDENYLRELEAEVQRYREEDTDLHREIAGFQPKLHAARQRAEEEGYARGLKDAQAEAAPVASAEPVATCWAIYYDNLGEQPYRSGLMSPFEPWDSEEEAQAAIDKWTHAKHYRPVQMFVYPAPVAQAAPAPADYGSTEFEFTYAGVTLKEGDKRVASLLVRSFGSDHPVMADFEDLVWSRRAAPAPEAAPVAPDALPELPDMREGFERYMSNRGEAVNYAGDGMYEYRSTNKLADAFRAGADYARAALSSQHQTNQEERVGMNVASLTHTARRPHICSQCGKTINTGEKYVRAARPGAELASRKPLHNACYRVLAELNLHHRRTK